MEMQTVCLRAPSVRSGNLKGRKLHRFFEHSLPETSARCQLQGRMSVLYGHAQTDLVRGQALGHLWRALDFEQRPEARKAQSAEDQIAQAIADIRCLRCRKTRHQRSYD